MTGSGGPAPVVVAIADGDRAGGPVEWAAAEAAARNCPLQIVHVPLPTGAAQPEQVLTEARRRTGAVAGDLTVTTRLSAGPVVPALLGAGEEAAVLVVVVPVREAAAPADHRRGAVVDRASGRPPASR